MMTMPPEESAQGRSLQDADRPDRLLAQPFSGLDLAQMNKSVDEFIEVSGLHDYEKYIRKGAFLAQSKAAFDPKRQRRDGLTLSDEEQRFLALENSDRRIDKFKQPWRLYALVGICSLGAAVQGWYVVLPSGPTFCSDGEQG